MTTISETIITDSGARMLDALRDLGIGVQPFDVTGWPCDFSDDCDGLTLSRGGKTAHLIPGLDLEPAAAIISPRYAPSLGLAVARELAEMIR